MNDKIVFHRHRNYFWGWRVFPVAIEDGLVHAFIEKDGGKWTTIRQDWFKDPKQLCYEEPMTSDEIALYSQLFEERKLFLALHNGA